MLKALHYTLTDVHYGCDLIDYIQEIVLHRKNFKIVTMNYVQVLLAYKHFNETLHLHLSVSTQQSIIADLIEMLNQQKHI